MNAKVKKELKALSKTRLLKLRADVNVELKEGLTDWHRSVPKCDDISCSKCDLMDACNFSSDCNDALDELMVAIKAELARR